MFNPFVIRKYAALLIAPIFTTTFFFIGLVFYNMMIAIACMFGGLLCGVLIGNLLLRTPFSLMLEGKGLLTINMDSTGVIRPFITSLQAPYMRGILNRKKVEDVFDRNAVFSLAAPKKAMKKAQIMRDEKTGKEYFVMVLGEEEYNKARFGFLHYPVLIYNEQLSAFLTKDFLSEKESVLFAEHTILYLNKKAEELTSVLRDFARHVVDSLKPKLELFKNPIVIFIIVVIVLVLIAMMFPSIMQAIGKSIPAAKEATTGAIVGAKG